MAGGFDQIAPAGSGAAVTPNDSNTLGYWARALYVGGAGDIKMDVIDPVTRKAAAVTFTAVPAGTILPWKTNKVYATGTTATSIVTAAELMHPTSG